MNHLLDGEVALVGGCFSEDRPAGRVVSLATRDCQRGQAVQLGENLEDLKPYGLFLVETAEDGRQEGGKSVFEPVLCEL